MIKEAAAKVIEHISSKRKGVSAGLNIIAIDWLKRAAKGDKNFYLSMLESSEAGLSEAEVEERQKEFGLNEVAHEKAPSRFIQLLHAFANPFTGILIAIAVIALITDVLI